MDKDAGGEDRGKNRHTAGSSTAEPELSAAAVQWLEENREAILAYNRWACEHPFLLDGLHPFD